MKQEYNPEAMDAAAAEAGKELVALGSEATVLQIADWWQRHYQQAGHKRLARILMLMGHGK